MDSLTIEQQNFIEAIKKAYKFASQPQKVEFAEIIKKGQQMPGSSSNDMEFMRVLTADTIDQPVDLD